MIASLDMSPFLSVSIGALLVIAAVWYWHQLSSTDVLPSTRGLRRSSLVFSVLAVVALVRAASFIDHELDPALYIEGWLAAIVLVFLVVVFIAFDVFNSFRVQRRRLHDEIVENASRLSSQLKDVMKASNERRGGRDEE